MLRFPLDGLLDEQACYEFLLHILHPDGLHCLRGHALSAGQSPHRRRRPVIPDYRCRQCGAVFNLFTSTIFWKTCYRCSTIVQILRFFRGISKWFLDGYIAVFECSRNLKWVTPTLIKAMMTPSTTQPT